MASTQSRSQIQPATTLVYKTVQGTNLDIHLDVFLPQKAPSSSFPVLLWFHGGGLLQGNRSGLPPWMRHASQSTSQPLAVISADYRLAPQASIAEIRSDVLDSIKYIRSQTFLSSLKATHPDVSLDTSRLAVSGSSAGGYLALVAGLWADPKPNVILPIYPITDALGRFFVRSQPVPHGWRLAPREELAPFLDPSQPQVTNSAKMGEEDARNGMYMRMMVDASLAELWGVEATGEEWGLSKRVYELGLPPMYVMHGDADTAVGIDQCDEIVGAALGVGKAEVVYERIHGKDHLFDMGEDYENAKFWEFLFRYLKT